MRPINILINLPSKMCPRKEFKTQKVNFPIMWHLGIITLQLRASKTKNDLKMDGRAGYCILATVNHRGRKWLKAEELWVMKFLPNLPIATEIILMVLARKALWFGHLIPLKWKFIGIYIKYTKDTTVHCLTCERVQTWTLFDRFNNTVHESDSRQ